MHASGVRTSRARSSGGRWSKKGFVGSIDLHFAESPTQGPDGDLYVSDFYAHEVLKFDTTTWMSTPVVKVPGQPSGLGWLPDGRLLVVSMTDHRLLAVDVGTGTATDYADLSGVSRGAANDMYVDHTGRAWVGSFGFDFYGLLAADPDADPLFGPGADPPTADIAVVDTGGNVRTAAQGLRFPNGTVQLTDGRIVIAETVGAGLTSFTIADDGALTDPTCWADLTTAGATGEAVLPDGICVDAEDAIWVSDPNGSRAIRVTEGGEVTETVTTSQPCFAVGLTANTLVCCTAQTSNSTIAATQRTGRLESVSVAVPGVN